ncbi:MAG: hypothetical protein KF823_06175 [Xanthomonadales bacterium]|nr:hypothetical protein [Xanthomonadales bacterium]
MAGKRRGPRPAAPAPVDPAPAALPRARWLLPALGLLVAAGLLILLAALFVERRALNAPFDPATAHFTGSAACQDCHGDRHETWYATYHRTMTQEATAETVQGRFDGQALDYWGVRVRPVTRDGAFWFDYEDLDTGESLGSQRIVRTVGSHRYQQYLSRLSEDETHVRLHYLWHAGEQRWVHMNAAFLGPDDQDFNANVAIWNQNCIFCHNTGPQPNISNYDEMRRRAAAGEPVNVGTDSRFDSKVAELGISCETCHGPGSEHVERAGSAFTRLAMRANRGRDASIVNPDNIDPVRATEVCGQCHGQRTPKPHLVRTWVETGPTYRAGQDLHAHVDAVWKHTRAPVAGQEDLFALRFWGDGTPRLSAYEYQGLLLSACHQQAQLSCIDCHTVHGGDPAGQITDRNRGNAPCLDCHREYRPEAALAEHTRHAPDGEGSLCYGCHMPQVKYGVMTIHRSHRIEVPDAARDAAAGRPNACLNCHLEQSAQWAADTLAAWAGRPVASLPGRADGLDPGSAEAAAILAGDPVQKAVLAFQAGRLPDGVSGRDRAFLVPFLLEAMADIYPSSRRFAWHSLASLLDAWPAPVPADVAAMRTRLAEFDYIGPLAGREAVRNHLVGHWQALDRADWPPPPPATGLDDGWLLDPATSARLVELGRRQDKMINIGE